MTSKDKKVSNLFVGICFYLNDSISPHIRDALCETLLEGGATKCPKPVLNSITNSSSTTNNTIRRFDETLLTHFITDSLDFPEYALLHELNGQVEGSSADDAGEVEAKIAIVTPFWVTRSYDINRLMVPKYFSANKALIFSGFCFCTSELPEIDNKAIQLGIKSMGGYWSEELTKEVTHLVVVAANGMKYEMATKHGVKFGIVVILPQWFDECLAVGQLVPTDLFIFPEPYLFQLRNWDGALSFEERLASWTKGKTLADPPAYALDESLTATLLKYGSNSDRRATETYQKMATMQCMKPEVEPIAGGGTGINLGNRLAVPLLAPTASILSNTSDKPSWPTPLPLPANPTEPIFSERIIYLASDLALKPGLEQAIKSRIESGGGKCWSWGVDGKDLGEKGGQWERRRIAEIQMKGANTVVTNHREGWEYWHAYTQGKTIGNLAWIYHILARSKLDSPLDRLIHYPLPPGEIEKFKNLTITITNYTGAAREYVRALIVSVGARFDGAMSRHTHYVITADDSGSKVKHAKQWEIPIVNHLWLEQCLLEWRLIPPTNPRFHTTPSSSVNYTQILGNTNLPIGSIEKWAEQEEVVQARLAAMEEVTGEDRSGEKFEDLSEQDQEMEEPEEEEVVKQVEKDVDMLDAAAEEVAEVEKEGAKKPEEKEDQLMAEEPEEASTADEEEEDEEAIQIVNKIDKKAVSEAVVVVEVAKKVGEKRVPEKKLKKKEIIPAVEEDTSMSEVEIVAPKSKPKSNKILPPQPPLPNRHHSRPALASAAVISNTTPREKTRLTKSKRRNSSSSESDNPPTSSPRKEIHSNIGTSNILPAGRRGAAVAAAANLAIQMPDANRFAAEQTSGKKRSRKESQGLGSSARKTREEEGEDQEEEQGARKKGKSKISKKEVSEDEEEESSDGVEVISNRKNAAASTSKKTVVGRSGAGGETQDGVISSFDNPPRAKPTKVKESTGKSVRVLCTGTGLDESSPEMKKFYKLGAKWTNHPSEVTHLVVKGILRTEKFLTCLAHSPIIADKEWITASLKAGKILDATSYSVHDKIKEKEIGITLAAIQKKIKIRKVFEGITIYLTPKISPETKVLQKIILAHGGVASLAPLTSNTVRRSLVDAPLTHRVVSCEADRKLWELLTSKDRISIFSVAAVLDGAMSQDRDLWNGERRIDSRGDL